MVRHKWLLWQLYPDSILYSIMLQTCISEDLEMIKAWSSRIITWTWMWAIHWIHYHGRWRSRSNQKAKVKFQMCFFSRNYTLLFSVVYCKLLKQLGMSQISFEMLLRANHIPKVPVKILFCCFLPKPRVLNPNLFSPTRSACTLKVKRRPSWISRSPHRMGTVHRRKSYDTCFLGLFRSLNSFLA